MVGRLQSLMIFSSGVYDLPLHFFKNYFYDTWYDYTVIYNTAQLNRLLFISGLECDKTRENIEVKMFNVKDIDRYINVMSMFTDVPVSGFRYDKDKAERIFKGEW